MQNAAKYIGIGGMHPENTYQVADIKLSRANTYKIAVLFMELFNGLKILAFVYSRECPELCQRRPKGTWKVAQSVEELPIDGDR
jgi:hypothetical protein